MNQEIPPIEFVGDDAKEALSRFLFDYPSKLNAAWDLFQLAETANCARMATTFDELLVMDHIQGFTPLAHQLQTTKHVLSELRGRAILADEVGLGKTIEAGMILKEYLLRGLVQKALILVPASLVLQWTRELREKFNIQAVSQKDVWTWQQYDVVVGSLDTAKRPPHRDVVLHQPWDLLVIDEAHKLKNKKTKNWEMANSIPNKYLLLLTATPMQNQLRELHTLVTLLKPGHLGNMSQFTHEHLSDRRTARDAHKLRQTVSDVMIRNRRQDGATVLPPREVQVVNLTLSVRERTFYDSVQNLLKTEYEQRKLQRVSVLPLLTLQRETCSSPYAAMISLQKMRKRATSETKQQQLDHLISLGTAIPEYTKIQKTVELLNHMDGKCVIFTEYRATQDFIIYILKKHGISSVPFRGGFKRGKKDWMKDLFSKNVRVLVATESGGEGINLQFCNQMINFDLPWNPMKLEQRIGRIHRLGQRDICHIYNLATNGTIEEHIVRLLYEKIRMFESVIGELDYIIGDKRLDKFEQGVFEAAMSSRDSEELGQKMDALSSRYMEQVSPSRFSPKVTEQIAVEDGVK